MTKIVSVNPQLYTVVPLEPTILYQECTNIEGKILSMFQLPSFNCNCVVAFSRNGVCHTGHGNYIFNLWHQIVGIHSNLDSSCQYLSTLTANELSLVAHFHLSVSYNILPCSAVKWNYLIDLHIHLKFLLFPLLFDRPGEVLLLIRSLEIKS